MNSCYTKFHKEITKLLKVFKNLIILKFTNSRIIKLTLLCSQIRKHAVEQRKDQTKE